jgi:hypothetical protein
VEVVRVRLVLVEKEVEVKEVRLSLAMEAMVKEGEWDSGFLWAGPGQNQKADPGPPAAFSQRSPCLSATAMLRRLVAAHCQTQALLAELLV